MATTPLRLVAGFMIAPLVVPLFFAIDEAIWGTGIKTISQIIGIFGTYGPYAYIFAFLLGLPVLWLLIKAAKTDAVTLAIAGAVIAALAAGFIFAIGLRSIPVIVISVAAGTFAGLLFRSIAGLK